MFLLGGCAPPGADDSAKGRPTVFVGIPPVAYLAERVSGGHVDVRVLLPPGQDPHTFEFTPKQIAALSRAQLFLTVGLPSEERVVEKIAGTASGPLIKDATAGIPKRRIDAPCVDDKENGHEHSDQGGHKAAPDPHVWLAPPLLKVLAGNIAAALEQIDPAHADDYRKNLAALRTDLDALNSEIVAALKPYRGQHFLVFHPAFGYFADAYGLRQEAVEAGGKSPTPKQLRTLIQKARDEGVKIIFVQPQFDQRSAQTVAEAIGGRVVHIDPLAKDVLSNLTEVAAKIQQGL
jgi:zinc transport system substrate-binding protein